MNTNDIMSQKMYEALETLKLSQKEMDLAEAYLLGEEFEGDEEETNKEAEQRDPLSEESILAQFSFRDLSGVPSDKVARLFRDFSKRGRNQECTRLFNLLFAIGQSTASVLISQDLLTWNKSSVRGEEWKKAALYASMIGRNQYYVTGHSFTTLLDIVKGKPEDLIKGIEVQKDKNSSGKLVLLATYFLSKYPNRDTIEEKGFWEKETERQTEGLLTRVGRLFSRKKAGKDTEPDPEDINLMKEYENTLLVGISDFFRNQIHMPNAILILDAIKSDQVTSDTLQLAGKNIRMSDHSLRLFGGLAYLNFPFSSCLKNIVKILIAANAELTLNAIQQVSLGTTMDLLMRGGYFDVIFDIDPEKYIRWAGLKSFTKILKIQLEHNEESYLKVLDQIDMEAAGGMLDIIRENNPDLHQKIREQRQKNGSSKQREKIIGHMVKDIQNHINEVKDYLRGNCEIEDLYPFADMLSSSYYYSGYQQQNILSTYEKNFDDVEFVRRCNVVMLFQKANSFFMNDLRKSSTGYSYEINSERVKKLFHRFAIERVTIDWQLSGLVMIYDACYSDSQKEELLLDARTAFAEYLEKNREETLAAFSKADATGRCFGLKVLRLHPEENKQEILAYSTDTSKAVKAELLNILYGQKDWEEEVKSFLSSKKSGERELAVRTLLHWQGEEKTYEELFVQALEKEKNAKMRLLLQQALQVSIEEGDSSGPVTRQDLVKEIHKGGKKRGLAWAYTTPFSEVHKTNGDLAEEEYLQAILLCYSTIDGCGVSKSAAILAEELHPEELAVYVNELFDKWMEAGAEAKKRWVLYASAIHGGAEIIKKLQHQLTEWPQNSRGAIAAEAVQALSLNPLPQALLIVDGISRKFKFKQVKAAAVKALEFAASQLGITTEELADRIVPDMGFDENVERIFDYGTRTFKVTMTPALEIEVYDESGKKLKNLPSPGKRDDEVKAPAAYEEFKQMKKQMKLTITSQKQRLEMALSTGREWSVEAWKALFVKNPVMHQFAIGLIWGTYNEEHELLQSFRYMEDGSFNTEDEEEYELPQEEEAKIGLVHPIELSDESRETWKEQLSDYEITQPFEQLERTIYRLTEEEEGLQRLERFGGCIMNDLSLNGKILGMGWYRGSVQDAGGFYTYYREDTEIGLGVELHFSGTYVSPMGEDVTIYDARFYKPGCVERGSYVYDEIDKKRAYFLKDVPARYFSEIVWQLTKITATSQERDESWRNDWPKEK